MYLQPIFSSADIKKSLQQYHKMYKQVDNRWKSHIKIIQNENARVLDFCAMDLLKEAINEDITILDKVQKHLEN